MISPLWNGGRRKAVNVVFKMKYAQTYFVS